MSQNLILDPVKRDYVFTNGSPTSTSRVEEASYYALKVPLGKWLYNPAQGSLLYTLVNKRFSSVEQSFASLSNEAITRQVVDPGLASNVGTQNINATSTGTSNQIEVIPAANQVSSQFTFTSV